MRLGARIITTMAVAFLLAPTLLLCADDTAKSAATAKKDGAVKSQGAPGAVAKAKTAAAAQESVPGKPKPARTPMFPDLISFWATRISVSGAAGETASVGYRAAARPSPSTRIVTWGSLATLAATSEQLRPGRASDRRPGKRLWERLHLHVWSAPFLPAREGHSLCPGSVWRRACRCRDAE